LRPIADVKLFANFVTMRRATAILLMAVSACSDPPPTPAECNALASVGGIQQRCFDQQGKYIGDEKCWPFSSTKRFSGVWMDGFESMEFYPGARTAEVAEKEQSGIWLKVDRELRPAPVLPLPHYRVYFVEFDGRQSLCDGMFGHMGATRQQIIVEKFRTIRRLK
jgi:hypothetical protein